LSGELFVEQRAELEAEVEIGQVAEVLHAEATGGIDQQEGGRALELVGLHGERDAEGGGLVDGDGELEAVFVGECLEGGGGHGVVVLEDGVEAEDGDAGVAELVVEIAELGNGELGAAGAEHPEGEGDDDAAAVILEARGGGGVEPVGGVPGGSKAGHWI
jgi:hypothetical protein